MSDCIFCERQLNSEENCVWCGFPQKPRETIPGTLSYGTKIKDYVIGNVISVDGESTTYLAFDKTIQQKVVVKEFLPVTLVAPRNGVEISVQPSKQVLFKNLLYDFVDMYQTLQKIKNPAMPKIHEVFIENKTAYAVLDYVKGVSLKSFLISRGKPLTFREVRWMLDPLFSLVDDMSKLNIHHGGISDETVMVTPDGSVMLTGFAIQDLRTKNEHIAYKLYQGFSAPEQYFSDGFQGIYTDIYALASLMYYSVTGKLFDKSAAETKEINRFFPKYAAEAIRYATKEKTGERIDSIEDFVMMLDDKGTVIKPKEQPEKINTNKKTVQYAVIAVVIIAVIVLAFGAIGGENTPSESESSSEISSEIIQETYLPNFVGYSYADVASDTAYQKDYTFVKLEAYSNEYSKGKICKQSPGVGASITPGTTVYLTVSLGPQSVKVPDIIGISYDDAVAKLDKLGIVHRKEYVDQTREFVEGMVADLSIDVDEEISINDDVLVVYVANDKPLATPEPKPTATPDPTTEQDD